MGDTLFTVRGHTDQVRYNLDEGGVQQIELIESNLCIREGEKIVDL